MSTERTPKNFGLSYDRGLALEKRAIANDPSCVECLATSAELVAGKGLMREALDTAISRSRWSPVFG